MFGCVYGCLVLILQSFNQLGIDVIGEMNNVQVYFSVGVDELDCCMNCVGIFGVCVVWDQDDLNDVMM